MEDWRIDSNNAQRLRYLIGERLQKETDGDCPGIGCSQDVQGVFYKFLVGDRDFVEVRAYIGQGNAPTLCHLRLVDGPNAPTAHLTVDGDAVLYWGRGGDQYQRVLAIIETHLARGFILPKLHMPYGFVQNETVVAIWYTRLLKGYMPGALQTSTTEFALQGLDLPAELLGNSRDTERYMQQYWKLMNSGHIVELGERISHPNILWFVSSNVSWPHLTFAGNEGKAPHMPADMPYLLRMASDPANSDLPYTRQLVAEYLQANNPPENLSEFFASHL